MRGMRHKCYVAIYNNNVEIQYTTQYLWKLIIIETTGYRSSIGIITKITGSDNNIVYINFHLKRSDSITTRH